MARKPLLAALLLGLLPLLHAAGEPAGGAKGVVIPPDVRAGLGDTGKTARVLPPDSGFVGLVISHLSADYGTITQVIPNGPGDKANLRKGDRIVKIGGKPIAYVPGTDDISPALAGKVGSSIEITLLRGTKTFTVKLERKKIGFKTVKDSSGQEKHVPVFE